MSVRSPLVAFAAGVGIAAPLAILASSYSPPNTFSNGTVADADQVNANFTAAASAINDNNARLGTLETEIVPAERGGLGDDLSTAAPGSLLVSTLSGSDVVWTLVPPGVDGQVLTMRDGVPEWAAPAGLPKSCAGWLANGATTDGAYEVDIAGAATAVYCDMTTDGGGWTLVWGRHFQSAGRPELNMVWQDAIFSPPLVRGDINTGPNGFEVYTGLALWAGLAPGGELRYDWSPGSVGSAVDQSYKMDFSLDATDNYRTSFSNGQQLIGTAVPGLFVSHNNRPFSTIDRDNDSHPQSCPSFYGGSPFWYAACWSGSINGGGGTSSHQDGAYWVGSSSNVGTPGGDGGGNGWIYIR